MFYLRVWSNFSRAAVPWQRSIALKRLELLGLLGVMCRRPLQRPVVEFDLGPSFHFWWLVVPFPGVHLLIHFLCVLGIIWLRIFVCKSQSKTRLWCAVLNNPSLLPLRQVRLIYLFIYLSTDSAGGTRCNIARNRWIAPRVRFCNCCVQLIARNVAPYTEIDQKQTLNTLPVHLTCQLATIQSSPTFYRCAYRPNVNMAAAN